MAVPHHWHSYLLGDDVCDVGSALLTGAAFIDLLCIEEGPVADVLEAEEPDRHQRRVNVAKGQRKGMTDHEAGDE